jgi:hypothetical protein
VDKGKDLCLWGPEPIRGKLCEMLIIESYIKSLENFIVFKIFCLDNLTLTKCTIVSPGTHLFCC